MLSSWRRVGGALSPLRSLVSWSQDRSVSSHSENTNTFVREVCVCVWVYQDWLCLCFMYCVLQRRLLCLSSCLCLGTVMICIGFEKEVKEGKKVHWGCGWVGCGLGMKWICA